MIIMVYSALFIAVLLAVICLPLVTEVVIRRAATAQTIGITAERARRIMATKPNEYLRFANCGFSDRTIRTLLVGGIDSPERLLSMTPNQIRLIRGMEVTVMKEVERYRTQSK
jgi:hypothetical protein